MFMRIIFKKLGLRQNKYILALVYGLLYAISFFLILFFASLYLNLLNIARTIFMSLFIGSCMFVVYLIKEELFKSGTKQ